MIINNNKRVVVTGMGAITPIVYLLVNSGIQ
jgi:hypothetical protein